MSWRPRLAAFTILTALLLAPVVPAHAAAPALAMTLSTTDGSPSAMPVSSVQAGADVSYALAVECSGATACEGAAIDLTSALVAAGGASYAGWSPPVGVDATIAATASGARITFSAPLPAGSSTTVVVTFHTLNWTTADGTTLDMTGHAEGANVASPRDVSHAVTLTSTRMGYRLETRSVSGFPASAGGLDYSYDVSIVGDDSLRWACSRGRSTPSGMLRLRDFRLTDVLPHGSEFVSASANTWAETAPTATHDPATRTVTSVWSRDLVRAMCGDIADGSHPTGMRVTVRWPASAAPLGGPPVSVTNTAVVDGTYPDGSPLHLEASTQDRLEPFQPYGQPFFAKGFMGNNPGPDGSFIFPSYGGWNIAYGNSLSSTVATAHVEITDPLLQNDVQTISFDPAARGTLEWTASDGSTGTVALPGSFDASALASGVRLTGFRVLDTGPLLPGETRNITLTIAPTTVADIGTTFENCATARFVFDRGAYDQFPPRMCARWRQDPPVPVVSVRDLLTHDASGPVRVDQPVTFHAAVQGDGDAVALHPQMTICVPPGWTVDPLSFRAVDSASTGFTVGAPVPVFDGSCITLTWPASVALTRGQQVRIDFDAVSSVSAVGEQNTFQLYGGDSTVALGSASIPGGGWPSGTTDWRDADGDGDRSEWLAVTTDAVAVTDAPRVGALRVRKVLAGAGLDAFAAPSFDFAVLCTSAGRTVLDEPLRLFRAAGDDVILSAPYADIPADSDCLITETDAGGADAVPAPVTVRIVEGQTVTADLTNRFSAATLTVEKRMTGPGAALYAANARDYPLEVTCLIDDGTDVLTLFSGIVEVPAGGRRTVEVNALPLLLPLGARCFAVETDRGYAARSEIDHGSLQDAVVVTAGGDDAPQELTITATNVFEAASFTVSKQVIGAGSGPYAFETECTIGGVRYPLAEADRLYRLQAGESRTISTTPGAVCTARELDAPAGARVETTDSTGDATDGSVLVVGDDAYVRVVNAFGPGGGVLALTGNVGSIGFAVGSILLLAGLAIAVVRRRRRI